MHKPTAVFLLLCTLFLACDSVQELPPEAFEVHDPYARQGSWYKANFHAHSSHSDGALSGEKLVSLYEGAGYGALCLSDHNQYGDQDGGVLTLHQNDSLLHDWNGDGHLHSDHAFGSGVEAYVRDWRMPRPSWTQDRYVQPQLAPGGTQIALLSGAETAFGGRHLGLIGHPGGWIEAPNQGTAYLQRTRAAGGFVYLAHPAQMNDNPYLALQHLDPADIDGIEIINGLYLSKGGLADATPLWDALLTRGLRWWGLANDDAHTWPGADDAPPFTAFNMVLTHDRTPRGFLEALHDGAFYATTGLLFETLEVRGNSLVVAAPGAERLRFIGNAGEVLADVFAPEAVYVARGLEGYVRVQADAPPDSNMRWLRSAWSQPFFIEPPQR